MYQGLTLILFPSSLPLSPVLSQNLQLTLVPINLVNCMAGQGRVALHIVATAPLEGCHRGCITPGSTTYMGCKCGLGLTGKTFMIGRQMYILTKYKLAYIF